MVSRGGGFTAGERQMQKFSAMFLNKPSKLPGISVGPNYFIVLTDQIPGLSSVSDN